MSEMLNKGYKYIYIEQGMKEEVVHKNPVYYVRNSKSSDLIGNITWSVPWRQFVFAAESRCIFSRGCLHDIADFIQDAMAAKHAAKAKT